MQDLIATARDEGVFTNLLNAAEILGLLEKYSSEGPYTVFAPTDDAFVPIPNDVIEEAFDDETYLLNIINYHIVEGKYTTKDLSSVESLQTMNGETIRFKSKDGKIFVENTPITNPDIECSNGIIHAIDDILLP
ncbi:putative surface protein with fasciclin (FAS1) repeats [Methanohalophilus levihalophilus]|uniref:fasciclin domain-containing protein n=1 Tax=Methanohalophilus levihalophilus TaxID=1431282 RepID=UPI001AE7C63F|nr:fasciclin domain-containing protein [Methanohalophilus levihalophilus]MBP2031185.1 putative surface protein with fasciclin (FAS1) repeats [Methanohalophilus levihalophilus]